MVHVFIEVGDGQPLPRPVGIFKTPQFVGYSICNLKLCTDFVYQRYSLDHSGTISKGVHI